MIYDIFITKVILIILTKNTKKDQSKWHLLAYYYSAVGNTVGAAQPSYVSENYNCPKWPKNHTNFKLNTVLEPFGVNFKSLVPM